MHQSMLNKKRLTLPWGWGGGTGIISHIGMCPPKGYGFWASFGLKTGIHCAIMWSGIGYGFRENYEMNLFMLSILNDGDMPI